MPAFEACDARFAHCPQFLTDATFVGDPLLPSPTSFMPPGYFAPRVEKRVACYMLSDYFVAHPDALPPSAYYPRAA